MMGSSMGAASAGAASVSAVVSALDDDFGGKHRNKAWTNFDVGDYEFVGGIGPGRAGLGLSVSGLD